MAIVREDEGMLASDSRNVRRVTPAITEHRDGAGKLAPIADGWAAATGDVVLGEMGLDVLRRLGPSEPAATRDASPPI